MNGLTALADPTRQRIVQMLAAGALSSGDIASRFEMTAPAVSQHLKTLRDAKLVKVRAVAQKELSRPDDGFYPQLYGLDATFRWKPLQRSIYRSFVGRSEWIWSRRDQPAGSGGR